MVPPPFQYLIEEELTNEFAYSNYTLLGKRGDKKGYLWLPKKKKDVNVE